MICFPLFSIPDNQALNLYFKYKKKANNRKGEKQGDFEKTEGEKEKSATWKAADFDIFIAFIAFR